jgi:PIN domain nuclease of toxin-antitoxin system
MASDPARLSTAAQAAIRRARKSTGLAIATITLLEIAKVAESNRIVRVGSVEQLVREFATCVVVKPMTPEIVGAAVRLPTTFPKDPADRLIAATALVEGMPLVTADQRISQSGIVQTIW